MKRRLTSHLILAGAVAALACVDLSAPRGPASISTLVLPSLFVVRGDVMRDSAGNPAAPSIIAFDQNGNQMKDVSASFFLTDSIPRAHLENGIIHGDSLGIAHLVGQIGKLQTSVFALPITVAPAKMFRVLVGRGDTLTANLGSDSANSRGTLAAQVRVVGADSATAVQGVRVSFNIIRPLPSRTASPAVFLTDDAGNLSQVDTTDASGLASRKVTLISAFLADPTIIAGRVDSVVILATAKYRGVSLIGSPVRIVMPVKVGISF